MVDPLPTGVSTGLHLHRDEDHTAKITLEPFLAQISGLPDHDEETPRGRPDGSARSSRSITGSV